MFVFLSKIAGFLLSPVNCVLLLGLGASLLLLTRFASAGRRLLVTSLVLLVIFGFSPLGVMLLLPLEERFPACGGSDGSPTGIIVLGGVVNPHISIARNTVALSEAAERVTAAVEFARRFPEARVVFSGGSDRGNPPVPAEAEVAAQLLERLGVPRARLVLETRSRNTAENAAFTRALVDPNPGERWLLVTSAFHMPRAVGTFRRVDFPVVPCPVDWQTRNVRDMWLLNASMGEGLRTLDVAAREWMGLIVYRLSGRSTEFFPGPSRP